MNKQEPQNKLKGNPKHLEKTRSKPKTENKPDDDDDDDGGGGGGGGGGG